MAGISRLWAGVAGRLGPGLPNTIVATGTIAGAGIVSGIVLARTLGPMQRGELASALVWPMTLVIAGDLGLGVALGYYAGKRRAWFNGLWVLALIASVAWGGLLVAGSELLLPRVLSLSPDARLGLTFALPALPFALAAGYLGYLLLGLGRFRESNVVRLLPTTLYASGVVVVAASGWTGVRNYSLVYLIAQVVTCAVAFGLSLRHLTPSPRRMREALQPVASYAARSFPGVVGGQLNLRLDQLLMTVLTSPFQLGLYVVAVAVAGLLSPLYSALAIVVLPRVTAAETAAQGARIAVWHVGLGLAVGVPLAACAMVVVPWGLPALFGPAFWQAVLPARVLLVGAIFQGANVVLSNSLFGLGQPGRVTMAHGLAVALTAALLWLLVPRFGALGASIAAVSSYAVTAGLQSLMLVRSVPAGWYGLIQAGREVGRRPPGAP